MRIVLGVACVALVAACGGKLADEGDAGDAGVGDVHVKKDATPVDSGPDAPPPSGGVNVSGQGPGYESENQIAVAPDGTIAVLWSAFTVGPPYVTMQYSFSKDDGKTFTPPVPIYSPPGLYPGDPAITVDPSGNFWAAYLGISYSGQSIDYSRVFVAEAPSGSSVFSPPIPVSDPNNTTDLNDHPKIFATHTGALLVGWADYPSQTAATGTGIVARSPDGTTWTSTALVTQPEAVIGTFFWFCEGASSVYTTFLEATNTQMFVGVRSSADDGVTFTTSSVAASHPGDEVAGLDPGCAASGNDLWVMYATTNAPSTDETTIDPADHLYVTHSGTSGASFDATHVDVLDKTASKLATIPLVARDETGKLDVAYVAGDYDGDMAGSIRFSRTDGVSVVPSTSVDGPMIFDLSRVDEGWLGDYFGGVVHGGAFYLAYPRNETGLDHIYFAKKALP
jgi:hypothetical protein